MDPKSLIMAEVVLHRRIMLLGYDDLGYKVKTSYFSMMCSVSKVSVYSLRKYISKIWNIQLKVI